MSGHRTWSRSRVPAVVGKTIHSRPQTDHPRRLFLRGEVSFFFFEALDNQIWRHFIPRLLLRPLDCHGNINRFDDFASILFSFYSGAHKAEKLVFVLNFAVGNNTIIKGLRHGSCVLRGNLMVMLEKVFARLWRWQGALSFRTKIFRPLLFNFAFSFSSNNIRQRPFQKHPVSSIFLISSGLYSLVISFAHSLQLSSSFSFTSPSSPAVFILWRLCCFCTVAIHLTQESL